MKVIILLLAIISNTAFSSSTTRVRLRTFHYDGQILSGTYATGPDCNEHTQKFQVSFDENRMMTKVIVYDFIKNYKTCENESEQEISHTFRFNLRESFIKAVEDNEITWSDLNTYFLGVELD